MSSKEFTKENLKNTQRMKSSKVEKYFKIEKAIEGSGESEYGVTRQDDEDLENNAVEKEGSGMDDDFITSQHNQHLEYSNKMSNYVDQNSLKEKFGKNQRKIYLD